MAKNDGEPTSDGAKPNRPASNEPGPGRRNYPNLNKSPTRLSGRFYSVADAAEVLDRSRQRISVFLAQGRLTGVMVGSVWLIAACSVERLADLIAAGKLTEALTEGNEALESEPEA